MVSIIIFTVASFMCGNSDNIWELIVFRFIQGLGGGALLVTAQTIITESYPIAKRGMAQAIYGMGVIVGPTLGPPLGGYLVDHFSWPYIFYINIPLGIIAAILAFTFVRSPQYGEKLKANQVDWWGIILLASFIGSYEKLQKELAEIESQIKRLAGLLSGPFGQKAPEAVVAAEREKLENFQKSAEKIRQTLV